VESGKSWFAIGKNWKKIGDKVYKASIWSKVSGKT